MDSSKKELIHLSFSTKAKTLEDLTKIIGSAKVLPIFRFSFEQYKIEGDHLLDKILGNFSDLLIVRSSSVNEDGMKFSNSGHFKSILNVNPNKNDLRNAIDQVFQSYGKNIEKYDEIFIQPMLKEVTFSGVAFTADINTLAPYYIINYDQSGSTDSVTSGHGNKLITYVSLKNSTKKHPEEIYRIIKACEECEKLFQNSFLDIEFAFSKNQLFLLQVRPIVKFSKKNLSQLDIKKALDKLNKKIIKLNQYHPKLLGSKTLFGVMPDWNPAEIIGLRPKRLAFSIYKELITDEIWAYQRDNYGYRNLRSFPLIHSFLGVPFVDVRVTLNSFVPKNLNDKTASKLVEYYLNELLMNVNNHDKIEFNIVFSCYYFGLKDKLKKLNAIGLEKKDIDDFEQNLIDITNSLLDPDNSLFRDDLKKIDQLQVKYEEINKSNLSLVDKIYWLIEDCKRFGTLPFAGVARSAFIATQLLNSFVDVGIMSIKEKNSFIKSIKTISKELSFEIHRLPKKDFLEKYGHLRPGSYDILSKRYDENFDNYFDNYNYTSASDDFIFSSEKISLLNKMIKKNGLISNADNLIKFIKDSIVGREYAKFHFSKHLSEILRLLEVFGNRLNINVSDLAHLDITELKNLYSTLSSEEAGVTIKRNIDKNKNEYEYTLAVKFPNLITNANDIYNFFSNASEPTFISLGKVKGKVVKVSDLNKNNLNNNIVLIESADPGYDYLFSKGIGGLITCYGGANSHMSIRCAEYGIPALIGCGEQSFLLYEKANIIELDALNKKVRIIS